MTATVDPPPGRSVLRRHALRWYLGGAAVLVVAILGGSGGRGLASVMLFAVLGVLSAGALIAGVVIHGPRRRTGWMLLAGSQVCFVVSTNLSAFSSEVLGDYRLTVYADALSTLTFSCMISGLAVIVRSRAPGWSALMALDCAIIVTSAALLSWMYLVGPLFKLPAVSGGEKVVLLSYPMLDLVLLTLSVRLALSTGRRSPALLLLLASFLLGLLSDTGYLLQRLDDTYTNDSWVGVTYILAIVTLTASGLHPSMRDLDQAAPARTADATVGRLVLLGVASLIAPAVLFVQYFRHDLSMVLVIATACALLFVLVLARMAGIVLAQRRLALLDALTGLYNRRFFDAGLERALATARRRGTPVSLAVIDVDRFKLVNDTHGHDGGDDVLRTVAERLAGAVREADLIARYGGEEFVVVLQDAGAARAADIGERLRRAVGDLPIHLRDGSTTRTTVSVGVATSTGALDTPEGLVRRADEALYTAKHTGRDRMVAAPAAPVGALAT